MHHLTATALTTSLHGIRVHEQLADADRERVTFD
jgi:hypothetical protein